MVTTKKGNNNDPYGLANVGNAFKSEPVNHSAKEDPLYKALGWDSERPSFSELKKAYNEGAKHGFNPNEEDRAEEGNILSKMYVRGFVHTQLEKNNEYIENSGKQASKLENDVHERCVAWGRVNNSLNVAEGAYKAGNQNSRIFRKKLADMTEKAPQEYHEKISKDIGNMEQHSFK